MKKYLKLIVIVLITVFSFTLFYVNVESVSIQFPQFKINNIDGEAKEIEQVQVEGHLYSNMNYYTEDFQIDTAGTTYYRDTPYFKLPDEYYTSSKAEKLIENHRNFMRGKDTYPAYFYEDDNIVAYANETYSLGSDEFVVDVLDKATNKVSGFSMKIPNQADYWYIEIEKVIVNENLLYIIAQNEPAENMEVETTFNSPTVANVYTIDITKEEIIDVVSIDVVDGFKTPSNFNGYMDLNIIYPEFDGNSEFLLTINKTTYNEEEKSESDDNADDEFGFESVETERIIKYDMKTQEQTEIELDEDHQLGVLIHYEKEIASFVSNVDQETVFKKVDLTNDKVLVEKVHKLESSIVSAYDFLYAPIKDGKVYMIQTYNEPEQFAATPLYVIDLANFEITYRGEVTLDEPYTPHRDMHYYLNGVFIKE